MKYPKTSAAMTPIIPLQKVEVAASANWAAFKKITVSIPSRPTLNVVNKKIPKGY